MRGWEKQGENRQNKRVKKKYATKERKLKKKLKK